MSGSRSPSARRTVDALVAECGQTYAEEAGIRLKDTPQPLYQLLVLSLLLSARIRASVAVAAARALYGHGLHTPRRMVAATWQQRVDALGEGRYRRYDERTATQLGEGAQLLLDIWRGDLRRLRAEADGDRDRLMEGSGGCRASDRRAPTSSYGKCSPSGRRPAPGSARRGCRAPSGWACPPPRQAGPGGARTRRCDSRGRARPGGAGQGHRGPGR